MKKANMTITMQDYQTYDEKQLRDICQRGNDFDVISFFLKIDKKIQMNDLDDIIIPENEDNKKEKTLFIIKSREIETRGYGGAVKIKNVVFNNEIFDVKIVLQSRFDKSNKQFFATRMLLDDENIYFTKNNDIDTSNNYLEIILLKLYERQLKEAYRQGIFKMYQTFEYNNMSVRGRINVSRHLKLNTPFIGNVAYSKREQTYDNDINRLILIVGDILIKKFNRISSSLKQSNILRELKAYVPGYSEANASIVASKCLKKITSPFFQGYEPLRKTCLMILRRHGVAIFDGHDKEIDGVLYSFPKQWERFLERQFQKYNNSDYRIEAQFTKEILFEQNSNKSARIILPDFVLKNSQNKVLCVLDAKMKLNWNVEDKREDIYQILSYMYLLNTNTGGVIYPTSKKEANEKIYTLSNDNSNHLIGHKFMVFTAIIPDVDCKFEQWNKKLDKCMKKLIGKICNM